MRVGGGTQKKAQREDLRAFFELFNLLRFMHEALLHSKVCDAKRARLDDNEHLPHLGKCIGFRKLGTLLQLDLHMLPLKPQS